MLKELPYIINLDTSEMKPPIVRAIGLFMDFDLQLRACLNDDELTLFYEYIRLFVQIETERIVKRKYESL